MPTQKAEAGFDFATSITKAMTPPETATQGKDLPDGFPFPNSDVGRVVDTSREPQGIPGTIAYDFTIQRKVFVIYRPWETCDRCTNAIANGIVTLPADEGDYECPHTMFKAYKVIIDKVLAGEFISGGEQEVVQKDGSIVISLRWYEKKLNHKRMRQLAKQNGDLPLGPG